MTNKPKFCCDIKPTCVISALADEAIARSFREVVTVVEHSRKTFTANV